MGLVSGSYGGQNTTTTTCTFVDTPSDVAIPSSGVFPSSESRIAGLQNGTTQLVSATSASWSTTSIASLPQSTNLAAVLPSGVPSPSPTTYLLSLSIVPSSDSDPSEIEVLPLSANSTIGSASAHSGYKPDTATTHSLPSGTRKSTTLPLMPSEVRFSRGPSPTSSTETGTAVSTSTSRSTGVSSSTSRSAGTGAVVTVSSSTTTSTALSPSSSSHPMNAADISGTVIGSLAIILPLIGTLLWYRRRKLIGKRRVAPSAEFMCLRRNHSPVLFPPRSLQSTPVHDTLEKGTLDVSEDFLPSYTPRRYTDDMLPKIVGDHKDIRTADEDDVAADSLGDEAMIDGAWQRSVSSWESDMDSIGRGIAF